MKKNQALLFVLVTSLTLLFWGCSSTEDAPLPLSPENPTFRESFSCQLPAPGGFSVKGQYTYNSESGGFVEMVKLGWNAVPGAYGYVLQVYKNDVFVENVFLLGGNKIYYSYPLQEPHNYDFRIASRCSGAIYGSFSSLLDVQSGVGPIIVIDPDLVRLAGSSAKKN